MSRLIERKSFRKLFSEGGIEVSDVQYAKFEKYAELLCEYNEHINLTAITDPEGIALKHFYDSVYPFTLLPPDNSETVIDVGTGAGFPSVPMAVMRPDLNLTLLDSLNKRINFLKSVCKELDIQANFIHGRAEEVGRAEKNRVTVRESYDIATARAVSRLRELCEYCLPFVKVGGKFYALKGKDGKQELAESERAIKLLGGEIEFCREYELPGGDKRVLIVIRKISTVPEKYPRNPGKIKKDPL